MFLFGLGSGLLKTKLYCIIFHLFKKWLKSSSTSSTSAVSTKTPEFIRLAILVDVKNANADQINPTAFHLATNI